MTRPTSRDICGPADADAGCPGTAQSRRTTRHKLGPVGPEAAQKGVLEAVAEALGHEAVDQRVDAAVHVREQVERRPEGLQVAVVECRYATERRQDVQDQDGGPADDEQGHDEDEHLDDLSAEKSSTS